MELGRDWGERNQIPMESEIENDVKFKEVSGLHQTPISKNVLGFFYSKIFK